MSLRLLSRFPKSLLKDEKHFVRKQPLSSQAVRRREPLQKGVVSDRLSVPSHIVCPEYSLTGRPHQSPRSVALYSEDDIPRLRKAARLARKMLEFANSLVTPGITTDEIDRLTHAEIVKHGAYPTPLNYCHFPKSICTSVNEVVCHGIPDSTVLQEGDIVSIDVSLYIDGFHGDNCGTVTCGIANPKLVALIAATKDAVDRAIAVCGPGRCISEIGSVIQKAADEQDYGVVHEFCGHGTGSLIHMPPTILHHTNKTRLDMRPGMVFTIEPIFVEGSRRIGTWDDGWTAATFDGGWAAQIEHEVLITDTGVEVLTVLE